MATTPSPTDTHDGHTHPHAHPHPHPHPHSPSIPLRAAEVMDGPPTHNLGPTYDSTVVMDVGGDTGGLVVYAEAEQLGIEVDIFPRGSAAALTHTAIRERHLPDGGVLYAGVYPGLPAGDYTVAALGTHPPVDVTVIGGSVVEIHTED